MTNVPAVENGSIDRVAAVAGSAVVAAVLDDRVSAK
jgi:hypothetical protein